MIVIVKVESTIVIDPLTDAQRIIADQKLSLVTEAKFPNAEVARSHKSKGATKDGQDLTPGNITISLNGACFIKLTTSFRFLNADY